MNSFNLIFKIIILMKLFNVLKSNFCYNKNNYNYLLLHLQWPTTFVEHNLKRAGNSAALIDHRNRYGYLFTIHGLWPQKTIGTGPTNCNHSDYLDLDKIKKVPKIEKYWTSFGMPTTNFWRYYIRNFQKNNH